MKQKTILLMTSPHYSDSVVSILTFSCVVGVLYWVIRLGCGAALRVIAGH